MMFAVYGGFALAFILSSAVSIALRNHGAGFWQPGISMMSMPLVAQFLMLIAVRAIVAIPSEPKARWVFRACEPADRHAAVGGARDAMLLLVVLPTTVFSRWCRERCSGRSPRRSPMPRSPSCWAGCWRRS